MAKGRAQGRRASSWGRWDGIIWGDRGDWEASHTPCRIYAPACFEAQA